MRMMRNNFIGGTLDFGIRRSKKFYINIISCFSIIFFATFIPLVAFYRVLSPSDRIGLIGFSFFSFFALGIALFFVVRQWYYFSIKINKLLNENESVQILANSEKVDEVGVGVYKKIKIAVSFIYEGKKIRFVAKKFDKQFKKWSNRIIKIIFIPKMEQVLLLKEE